VALVAQFHGLLDVAEQAGGLAALGKHEQRGRRPRGSPVVARHGIVQEFHRRNWIA
jgi:hypothetical protein